MSDELLPAERKVMDVLGDRPFDFRAMWAISNLFRSAAAVVRPVLKALFKIAESALPFASAAFSLAIDSAMPARLEFSIPPIAALRFN